MLTIGECLSRSHASWESQASSIPSMKRHKSHWKDSASRCPTEIRSTISYAGEKYFLHVMILEIELRKEIRDADWYDRIGPYGSEYGSTPAERWQIGRASC